MPARKRPLAALLLTLAIPGLGQVYNNQATKGLIIVVACLLFGLGMAWVSGLTVINLGLALALLWISAIIDAYKTAENAGMPLDWYYRVPYVVGMLLLVGPLALPLLWRSPHFSRPARWTWTVLVIGVALLALALPQFADWLMRRASELGSGVEANSRAF